MGTKHGQTWFENHHEKWTSGLTQSRKIAQEVRNEDCVRPYKESNFPFHSRCGMQHSALDK
uniref:Uncharacterized protein n=1 Tax=Solanum tuberosum TaxID=4113 RepID=M1A6D3_SOLTU